MPQMTENTYKTVPIRFDGEDAFRSGDLTVQRDLQIVNMYYDKLAKADAPPWSKQVRLRKRPGLASTTYNLSKTLNTDALRGYFYNSDNNAFYWAVNNKVYTILPDSGTTVRTVCTLATSSGHVGFCSSANSTTNVRYVIITDGTNLWVDNYATTTCTQVTSANLPTPHQPYPLYVDGYVMLIKSNTGDMYNSNVDDPTTWTAGEYISAEISSDYSIRPFKVKNYIIVLGTSSIEYFYDAGNATGSPFSRQDSPFRNVGYVTGGQQSGDTVFFVGQDEKQNLGVYTVNSFQVDRVSTAVVDRKDQTVQDSKLKVYGACTMVHPMLHLPIKLLCLFSLVLYIRI
jgi:hypothetical protein